jgi:hypothetical protein
MAVYDPRKRCRFPRSFSMSPNHSPARLIALLTFLTVVAVAVNVTWRRDTHRRFNSAAETRDALLGKTAAGVRSLLGEPAVVSSLATDPPHEVWQYNYARRVQIVLLLDENGTVYQVDQYRPDAGPRRP